MNNNISPVGGKIAELASKSLIYEVELLGRLLQLPAKVILAASLVSERDFNRFGKVFSVIIDAYSNNKHINEELRAIGINYDDQAKWQMDITSYRPIEAICEDLIAVAKAIRLHSSIALAFGEIDHVNADEIAASMQLGIIEAISGKEKEPDIRSLIDEFNALQANYIERFKLGKGLIGLSTGIEKLDEMIDGIRPPHIWVMAGFTSLGKTFAALNIAVSLIRQKKRVVIYSLEMSKVDILARVVGIMTGFNGTTILKGYPHDAKLVEEAMKIIRESGLMIFTEKFELNDIQFSMYEQTTHGVVDLFIVDYLQLVTMKGARSEYESTTSVALGFQKTAKKLHCPIMELSQINNESAKGESEIMGFKGSGAIAAAADLAIEIVKGDMDKEVWKALRNAGEKVPMRWMVRKNRHGKSGIIPMTFDGRTGISCYCETERKFEEITKQSPAQAPLPLADVKDEPF